jgi:hypothetical protein
LGGGNELQRLPEELGSSKQTLGTSMAGFVTRRRLTLDQAPQTFKAKFNLGEHTKDAVYMDAERRFQELETETKKLHDESKRYFDAINGMLSHQIEFSQAIAEMNYWRL